MLEPSDTLPVRVLAGEQPDEPPSAVDRELVALVRAGLAGEPIAFSRLVVRYDRMLRRVARFYGLRSWDVDDVVQSTWLQFLAHGRDLREPAAVAGWLATTARRLSLRVLQANLREPPTDDSGLVEELDHTTPDDEVLAAEQRAILRGALAELPERHRQLMTLLVTRPELSYEEVGDALSMPVGSIGPIRARSIDKLRRSKGLLALRRAGEAGGGPRSQVLERVVTPAA